MNNTERLNRERAARSKKDEIAEDKALEIRSRMDNEAQLALDREKLLQMPEFRRYITDILGKGQLMHSIMTGNSMTYYNAGKQDFARLIWAELAAVDQAAALKLMTITKPENKSNG